MNIFPHKNALLWMNIFPHKNGIYATLSWQANVTGSHIDYH